MLFGFGVHGGKTIVENQQWSTADQSASQRRALLLTTGEGHASLTENGVQPFREVLDGFLERCCVSDLQNFLMIPAGVIVGDVVTQAVREQKRILQHHADTTAQKGQRIA